MRCKNQVAAGRKRRELGSGTAESSQRVRVENHRACSLDQCRNERPASRLATEARAYNDGIRSGNQLEESRRWRLVEVVGECLYVRFGLDESRHAIRRSYRVHQAGSGAECGPRRHPKRTAHTDLTTDDDDSPAAPFVVACPEPA
jgi:hypothetical protein